MQPLAKEVARRPAPGDNGAAGVASLWPYVAAAALLAFYFATFLYISSHRLLWVDEVLTVLHARLPHWTDIWKISLRPGDGLPPTYFITARFFDQLFGQTDFSIRLASVLAVTIGLFLAFDSARRLTDGLHGLIAIAVLSCSFLPYYGHEARSYGLYFLFACVALWIWIRDQNDTFVGAFVFGTALLLAVAMHYYAILCLVPYAVWQVWNWKPWHLPEKKLIAGVIGVLFAAALLWKQIQAGRLIYPTGYWSRPSFDVLRTAYADLFPDALFLLALVLVWIAWVSPKDQGLALQPMPSDERLAWFFLLMPAGGYLLAQVAHAFQLRYVIGALPGIAVALSCWLWRNFHNARRVSIGVVLILASWGVAKQIIQVREPNRFYYSPVRTMVAMEDTLRADGKRFFVLSNQARYVEARHYSRHPDAYALLTLTGPDDLHEAKNLAQYYPFQFWTLEDLKKHAGETALLAASPDDLDSLRKAGLQPTVHLSKPLSVVYLQ